MWTWQIIIQPKEKKETVWRSQMDREESMFTASWHVKNMTLNTLAQNTHSSAWTRAQVLILTARQWSEYIHTCGYLYIDLYSYNHPLLVYSWRVTLQENVFFWWQEKSSAPLRWCHREPIRRCLNTTWLQSRERDGWGDTSPNTKTRSIAFSPFSLV